MRPEPSEGIRCRFWRGVQSVVAFLLRPAFALDEWVDGKSEAAWFRRLKEQG